MSFCFFERHRLVFFWSPLFEPSFFLPKSRQMATRCRRTRRREGDQKQKEKARERLALSSAPPTASINQTCSSTSSPCSVLFSRTLSNRAMAARRCPRSEPQRRRRGAFASSSSPHQVSPSSRIENRLISTKKVFLFSSVDLDLLFFFFFLSFCLSFSLFPPRRSKSNWGLFSHT